MRKFADLVWVFLSAVFVAFPRTVGHLIIGKYRSTQTEFANLIIGFGFLALLFLFIAIVRNYV